MESWSITIPGNPVAQARPRFARIGNGVRAYDTKPVKDYKAYLKMMVAGKKPEKLFNCALSVNIIITILRPKSWSKKRVYADTKPDVDNFAKLICDCLEGIVYTNDSRIVELNVRKQLGSAPSVQVIVSPMEDTHEN